MIAFLIYLYFGFYDILWQRVPQFINVFCVEKHFHLFKHYYNFKK